MAVRHPRLETVEVKLQAMPAVIAARPGRPACEQDLLLSADAVNASLVGHDVR